MPASPYAIRLAETAQNEHTKFMLMDEADPELCEQIKKYWKGIAPFQSCVSVPWSAVFVSWCVKQAGATKNEFRFAAAHSVFVYEAIQNTLTNKGVFRGLKVAEYKPSIGDIIQNNRDGTKHGYDFARVNQNYSSHSAIVVETGTDSSGRYALTVGGNEGNSIRRTVVRLTNEGFIQQRPNNPFICVIQNLK